MCVSNDGTIIAYRSLLDNHSVFVFDLVENKLLFSKEEFYSDLENQDIEV